MKTDFMKSKIVSISLGIATALLLNSNVVHAAANCSKLVGTWQANFRIIDSFTDVFVINKVSRNGAVLGVSEFGIPMHGFCKSGVVTMSEDYATNLNTPYLSGYYFVNGTPRFAQESGTLINLSNPIDIVYHRASIKKISNSTVLTSVVLTTNKMARSRESLDYLKQQQVKKLYSLHQKQSGTGNTQQTNANE